VTDFASGRFRKRPISQVTDFASDRFCKYGVTDLVSAELGREIDIINDGDIEMIMSSGSRPAANANGE